MSNIIDTSIKKAVKGTTFILTSAVVSALLLITTKIMVARHTTKEELGAYTLSLAIASGLAFMATLGIHEGIARYVSLFLGRNQPDDANGMSRAAIRISLVSGSLTALLLYLCADFLSLSFFHSAELIRPLRIVSLFIPFFVMAHTLNAILRGHGIIASKIYYLDVGIPLFFLLLLSAALLLGMPFFSILYAYVFAVVLACISIGWYGYRKIGLNPFQRGSSRQDSELIRFSFSLLIGIMLAMIINWTATLMLGRYAGMKTVGVYEVSSSLSGILMFPLAALEFVFLPIAGMLHGRDQSRELARTYQVLTKWIFSVTAPIFFLLFFFPEQIISVLFGDRFLDAVPALRILSCGLMFHALWGPNGILMVVIGMPREISTVSLFGAILNIALNYLLINYYGMGIVGAAVAMLGTYVILNILVTGIIYAKCGIHPFTTPYGKTIGCAAITGTILFLVSSGLPRHVWLVPLSGLFFVAVFGGLLVATRSIDTEDLSLFKAIVETVWAKGRVLKYGIGRYF